MWECTNGYGWGWGWGGMGLGILFWGILIASIAILFKRSRNFNSVGRKDEGKTVLDILNERYARGDIERDEFVLKKHDLKEDK